MMRDMAITLVIRSGGIQPSAGLTFDSPLIVIGRGDSCDCRLPDPSVSHRHASLRQRGQHYVLQDEGSTNGTFLGQVRLPPHAPRVLESGDLLRVGRVWIEARLEPGMPTAHPKQATRELALALVAQAMEAAGDCPQVVVRVTSGADAGQSLTLEQPGTPCVLGRNPDCDLVLAETDASRRHLELVLAAGQVAVTDLGSKNGTLLDGQRLAPNRRTPWAPGGVLTIGGDSFELDNPVVAALKQLEVGPDEPMDPAEVLEVPGLGPEGSGAEDAAVADAGLSSEAQESPLPARSRAPRPVRHPGWGVTDLVVALVALLVLGLSIAGMAMLFR